MGVEGVDSPMDHVPPISSPNPELLVVDDVPMLLHSLGRLLETRFGVAYATSGAGALELLEEYPSLRVVISDYAMEGMSGIDLFKRTAELYPAVARVLLTGVPELDIARDAIQETRLHRFLCKPCGPAELMAAVDSGIEAHSEIIRAELEAERLVFSNESLTALNRNLEERVNDQSHSILCLRRLGLALNRELDVREIATVAAGAACQALENRGVYIQFRTPDDVFIEGSAGPEMSSRMIGEPLTTRNGVLGEIVVDVVGRCGREISTAQQNILAAIASMTAVAIHNEVRRKQRDEAQYETVFALASLSERRDRGRTYHLERISEYCRQIAETLIAREAYADQLTPRFVEDLALSAPLRDIGKVGIPDSILLKRGRLTATERRVMESHVQVGADALGSVLERNESQLYLAMGLDIALSHHERWDGSGYPSALAGEEIPLSARIAAIADVYDALMSVRPHKGAWRHAEARAQIEQQRGLQFDPEIVDAFLDCEQEFFQISEKLADPGGAEASPEGIWRRGA